jgi:hypothetical protein
LIDGYLHGLTVSSKTLGQGPAETVDCLLHEAAHVLCWVRGRSDTTSRGYYHTAEYRQAAEALGLQWPEEEERSAGRGYAEMRVPPALLDRYAPAAAKLEAVVPDALPAIMALKKRDKRAPRPAFQCECAPPRKIWAAQSTMDLGGVTCSVCGKDFT